MLTVSNETKEIVLKHVSEDLLCEALKFSLDDIYKVREEVSNYYTHQLFRVFDRDDYHVNMYFYANDSIGCSCTCDEYRKKRKCRHIALSLLFRYEDIFEVGEDEKNDFIFNKLFDSTLKQLVNFDVNFTFDNYMNKVKVKFKIGLDKMYVVGNKINNFFNNYDKKEFSLVFGNNFTFFSNNHKLSEKDIEIIEFVKNTESFNSYLSSELFLNYIEFNYLLNILGDKVYSITNYGNCVGYKKNSSNKLLLSKDDDKFEFDFDYDNIEFLDCEHRYVYDDGLCLVDEKTRKIYNELKNYGISKLKLDESNALKFSEYVGSDFKDNFIVSDEIKDKFLIIEPKVKLYFDLDNDVCCRVMFDYSGNVVNYFDSSDFLRNKLFENKVIERLKSFNFLIGDDIRIKKLDDMVKFVNEDIFKLKEEYEVFTTKNLNDFNISKPYISSDFSIGKDNVFSYKFELGEIDKELNKVFESAKNLDKYYRLKNGNVIELNNDVFELMDIMEELDIQETEGEILKYRALYLDSLKNFNIINTNNLFKDFVDNFKKNKNASVDFNASDLNVLRDYQKFGVEWLHNIYKSGFGGILADEMGLGKTIQSIIFVKEILKKKKCKILIISPTSLIYNWENEILKFGDDINYKVVADSKDKRIEDLNTDYDVYITSYGRLRLDSELYEKMNFEIVIIDEAQNIKNPQAGISKALKNLKAECKIALTGTPVENSVIEIWSIFDFILPGLLGNLKKFQNKYSVKDMDETAHERLVKLSSLINPFILRRKKIDVLADLPSKIENNIYLDLGEEQKKLYAMQVKKTTLEFEELMALEGFLKARFKILQLITRLRQICIDPSLVFDYKSPAIKMVETLNLVRNYINNGHKILIFSSFKSALCNFKNLLDENNISSYMIDGSVSSKNRSILVENFNKDNTNVFLITLKAGGTGLNLTSADVVIHLDMWWNPQVENQATDRAHRIGQKKSVEVVKLICKGTIEEKILELQEKKKILNDVLIDGENENVLFNSLNEDDIKELLTSFE